MSVFSFCLKLLNFKFLDVNAKSGREGFVPLHIAGKYNCLEAAQALLQFRAKISVNCKTKESPLHFCARYGSIQVAEVFTLNFFGSYSCD